MSTPYEGHSRTFAASARLLPAFDPDLLGWKDRSLAVPDEHARRVHPGGGVLRATSVDGGVAVGTWSLRKGAVSVEWFGRDLSSRFADEIADVERFASEPAGTLRR